MRNPHVDCEQVLRQLLEYLDRALDDDDMELIGRHLEHCRACFGRAEFEKKLKESLRASGAAPASARLRARIKRIVRSF